MKLHNLVLGNHKLVCLQHSLYVSTTKTLHTVIRLENCSVIKHPGALNTLLLDTYDTLLWIVHCDVRFEMFPLSVSCLNCDRLFCH